MRRRRVAFFLLFVAGLLVLVGTSIDQSIVYPSPDSVSTYYEYTTLIINGTALNSTDNIDADDEVYYAVDSDAGGGIYEVNVEHMSGQVNESLAHITQIFFEDNFKFNETVTAYLEWFNWTANTWVNINNGIVGSTEVAWNKTWSSRFSDTINSTGYMKTRIYTLNKSNTHRLLEDYLHWDVTYVVPDTTPPEWSNAGTNNTAAGQPTLFHIKWTDDIGLSGFIFGTNNTGTWTNDTWTPMSGTTDWSNVTKILNSTGGLVVQWRAWANDTSNNWNDTGILSLTTTQPPVASFIYSPLTPHTGENVTFNATDSYDPDGTIASYFWDFGDGTNASGVSVTHSYADNGTYTVTLTVTDNDGLSGTTSANVTALNRLPVAIFTESAETVSTSETITFNASASYDPDGSIVSYSWDFGDGTNATGVIASHAYADNGTYTVTLTVTDNDGAIATANATKIVLNRPPVASFTESATTVYTGEVIYFNASASYDPDGSIGSYFWDFGDGTNVAGITVNHTYADNGTYTVNLTVTDNDGATASTNATKTVLNRLPVPSFTESATTVLTREAIKFNASTSYDPDGSIVSYGWNFGDGNTTVMTTSIITHAYDDGGTYTVTLTVTDDDGGTASTNATKTVLNRPPVASFTESATTAFTGEPIYFNASSSYDPDGTIVSYWWDFGDGTNATGVTTTHSYANDGNYTVTLTVTDDDGATNSSTSTKTVLNSSPVASFTESATTVYTNETITFNASASYDPDGFIVSYLWSFGDGTNATGVAVNHAYSDNGTYIVTLTVIDDDGATSTAASIKTVLNRPPVASFTESAGTVYTGVVISFNGSDSYDLDGTIGSYFWDFGDGTNATGVAVGHAYADNGNYTVTLTVTDDDGATGIATATKSILNRYPTASFSESATIVYTGEVIHFNASGSSDPDGVIVSYFWDFGDGTNTTGITADHAYADDGTYTVVLTVTDDDGATGIATATKTVLNRSPVASFTESAETVYTNEGITFNASSSYDPDGTIVSYFWDFGDGNVASGVLVNHAYEENGVYNVTLTVIDDDDTADRATSTKTVLNRSPVASFAESAESVYSDEVIYFNASDSYDPDGSIVGYFWDFGDGTNATGVTAGHSYVDDGNYTVTLTVTDDDGANATANSTKTVLNRPPVASFTESAETVVVGEVIYFNASSSYDLDGYIVSCFWDFGDGTNSTGVTTEHAYTDDGVYTVTLTVTDDDGATASANSTKTVGITPPVAIFSESAETAYTNEVIHFNASASYDPDGYIVSYFWDFGDGANATGVIVDHAYVDNGTYAVTLTVTDDDGATDTATATKTVLNRSPVAIFSESATAVLTDEVIYFNASDSYDPDGTIVSYFWDFGDGTNATGLAVEHAYADDGNYTVTLTVTDDDGATASAFATKTVLNRSPVAIFTESAETVITDEVIYFNASGSYDSDGYIVSYFWDFGDGTNATGVTAEHSYALEGIYTVTLTITDNDGATASNTAIKTVGTKVPVALFTESAEIVLTGETIYFNASGSYDPDGYIVSYFWDFGDGTNATGVTAEHAYTDDGNYTVTLTVTDDDGATGTTTSAKTVLNRSPVAVFIETAETVYTNEIITFNATASSDPDGSIVSYTWAFGDGNVTTVTNPIISHAYADDGNYTVTLTVTDDDSTTGIATASKTVLNRSPVASFTESSETVYTNEIITFNASATYDFDGSIVSYFWDFGDGANATGVIVDHAYVDNGTYAVTLTVTDDDGATDTATATKTVLNQPPVAKIVRLPLLIVETGEVIHFDASTSYDLDGVIVSYFWDFGDGTNATGIKVDHAYEDNGQYAATLVVTDDDGAIGQEVSFTLVKNRGPVALFTESAETVFTGETIYFNASGSYDPDGYIVSYFWDFGDGTNATGVIVEHSYVDDGVYSVNLIITDDDDAKDTATSTKTVLNRSPVASFTESAETVYTGEVISFDASISYDPDGVIVRYHWNFGDETSAIGVIVNHVYADDGIYIVTLTVEDDDGAFGTANSAKTVLNRSPVANFTESATTVLTNVTITFDASESYDLDGVIVSYFWDFGDGINATDVVVDHAYMDNGNYTVTLTVTDDDGATDTATLTKTVINRPPIASFTESAEIVVIGESIMFNASDSYDPDGSIVSYFWDFGDGKNASAVTVLHAYEKAGNYTVTIFVIDDDGATDTATANKTVYYRYKHDIAIISVTPSETEIYQGQIVNITVVVRNEGNETETSIITAYCGNNTVGTQTVTNLPSGENVTLIFVWNTTGVQPSTNYTITVEANVVLGEIDTSDNTFTDGTIRIKWFVDLNDDGIVDIVDIVIVALAFGSSPEDDPETPWDDSENWNPVADLNGDGIVDIVDIVLVALHFGESAF